MVFLRPFERDFRPTIWFALEFQKKETVCRLEATSSWPLRWGQLCKPLPKVKTTPTDRGSHGVSYWSLHFFGLWTWLWFSGCESPSHTASSGLTRGRHLTEILTRDVWKVWVSRWMLRGTSLWQRLPLGLDLNLQNKTPFVPPKTFN